MPVEKRYLELCQELKRQGLRCEFVRGSQIARGFADLGHEQFTVIGPQQILSNFTGAKSSLAEPEREFFFWVPDADDLVECIQRADFNVLELQYQEQRSWVARVENIANKEVLEFAAPTLLLCLGKSLCHCLGIRNV